MIIMKSDRELELMRRSNAIVAEVLCCLRGMIKPGMSTYDLDLEAENIMARYNVKPAFKGYHGFPNALCASINEEIVHGIPSRKRILKDGDIISLDFGVVLNGYYGDAAITVPVGTISTRAQQLVDVTRQALYAAIDQCRQGRRLNDIARAVESQVRGTGFSIIRDFVGHGIGRTLHEAPQIPNYFDPYRRERLRVGMVLAIEPMISEGTFEVKIRGDGWTAVTADGKLSAHFEHTVAITEDGPEILSEMGCYNKQPQTN
ncbi:type I methionyl aminopeptidase [bacterium]|nr:type I methionyl aminopeptidase [candidate division CSSED10-310 bacterium]